MHGPVMQHALGNEQHVQNISALKPEGKRQHVSYKETRKEEKLNSKEMIKSNGKFPLRTGREDAEREYRSISTLHLISALDGGGLSTPRSGRFTALVKTRHPLNRRLSRPHGQSGRANGYGNPRSQRDSILGPPSP